MCQIKNSKNQNLLYRYLVTPTDSLDLDFEPDGGSVGKRKLGADFIPQKEKDDLLSTSIDEIVASYRVYLSSALKDDRYKKAFIIALKDVLREDITLSNEDIIGTKKYTKENIIKNCTFDFFHLIANVMKFCASQENIDLTKNIKEITKGFVENKLSEESSIYLENYEAKETPSPLLPTIYANNFSSVFTEINPNSYSLSLPNPNKIKLYKLKVSNKEFDKTQVIDFILDNISQYVYSRRKIKDISDRYSIRTISSRAIRELKKTPAFTNQKNTFCEIMLYSFMESSMKAYKVLSAFEVNETGKSNKYSSGIYLLPAGAISSNNQIVFGCTNAHDNLKTAIDDVLNQAATIKSKRKEEIMLLDASILNNILEPEVSAYVKNVVTPKRGSAIETDDAFGLFLTYSVNVPKKETMSNSDYRVALEKQMDEDIRSNLTYILSQISKLELSAYSFYFFILPLDKVNEDTKTIMSESVGGGD
jgi:hypothetical protein